MLHCVSVQVLLVAKQQLEVVVDRRFDDAVARHDATDAVRFARLYKPLGKQVHVSNSTARLARHDLRSRLVSYAAHMIWIFQCDICIGCLALLLISQHKCECIAVPETGGPD